MVDSGLPSSNPSANELRSERRLLVRTLGESNYVAIWKAMQSFTDNRGAETGDELWLVEHPPVFTLGLNGKPEHLLHHGDIPVVQVDRGGQVTYHGPGQYGQTLQADRQSSTGPAGRPKGQSASPSL